MWNCKAFWESSWIKVCSCWFVRQMIFPNILCYNPFLLFFLLVLKSVILSNWFAQHSFFLGIRIEPIPKHEKGKLLEQNCLKCSTIIYQSLMQWFFQVLKCENQFIKRFLWLLICGSNYWLDGGRTWKWRIQEWEIVESEQTAQCLNSYSK